jgi:rubrerythrin
MYHDSPEMKAAMIEDIIAALNDTQYYCEKCDHVHEYTYPGQENCKVCGTYIQDNNVAEI